ncbi:MAG: chromate transporter [Ruminococcaceae bacterium]|nr:chromate transporter [Oscillospiraceae bacterium]
MIYLKLLLTFFKIGAFTIGGGYAMLPFIEQEVTKNAWVSEAELIDFVAVSESTPGPFAINIATFIGMRTAGILGAICTTLGVVLPSFIIIIIVACFLKKFQESKAVKGALSGLKPAVPGLIAAAIIAVAGAVLAPDGFSLDLFKSAAFYCSLVIFGVAAVLCFKKVHPIWIVSLSAVLGIACGYIF